MDKKINHEAQTALDQPLVKVPMEFLQKSLRNNRKNLERDFSSLGPQITESNIDQSIARVESLKRKLDESSQEEVLVTKRMKARIAHLDRLYDMDSVDSTDFMEWSNMRVYRLIIDHMLRNGYHETAKALAAKIPGLNELVDVDLFESTCLIEASLKSRSCADCLAWCQENRPALKKLKSPLEFMLRVQEYVELLRSKSRMDAIIYSRKYFPSFADTFMPQIQQATALLAFFPSASHNASKVSAYQELLSEARWDVILKQFRADTYQLYSLPTQSLLSLALQSGLASLKTQPCYRKEDKNLNCPVCSDPFNSLARRVPFSHHVNSTIVCRVTGEVMDENNPPMVLPNGNVYSRKGVLELLKDGTSAIDPRSGDRFTMAQCKKAFLA